jgi:hypothetical protein
MPLGALGPFFAIAFGLGWGAIALLLLFTRQIIVAPLGMANHGTDTFASVPGGTQLRWSEEVRAHGVSRLLAPVFARLLAGRLDRAFANLKRLLETGQMLPLDQAGVPEPRQRPGGRAGNLRAAGTASDRSGPLPLRRLSAAGLAAATLLAGYLRVVRPWQLRWGATDEEVARGMPGDEIIARPTFNATRAVTVHARPAAIWPWLLQLGCHRAGWYSYDLLDNTGRPSAERILPEFQHLAPGDLVPMNPSGTYGIRVRALEPPRWMLWADDAGSATWTWVLDPVDEATTRLLTRVRMRYRWTSPTILAQLLFDAGDIVMMRKCLFGIKRRAERLSAAARTAQ